jgi:hypothetical protein
MRLRLGGVAALAFFTMAGCLHSSHQAEIDEGVAVATKWEEFVDAGKYDQALALSDNEVMMSFGGPRRFIRDMRQINTIFGKELSRSIRDKAYEKDPKDAGPGEFVRIHFECSRELASKATELMLIKKQDDGAWKVHQYTIQRD